VSTPEDRPSREDLPGSSGAESAGDPRAAGGWLPPAEQPEGATDPAGRPWERPPSPSPSPSSWPGAGDPATPQAPAYASWPGSEEATAPARAGAVGVADYGPRALAAFVDFLIRLVIALVVVGIFAGAAAAAGGDPDVGINLGSLLATVVGWVYATVMIAQYNGQTVGHKASSTRIVRADGSPLSAGQAFVREALVKSLLFEFVGVIFLLIPFLLNYLWPLWDKDNEALHDKICSTRVVDA